MLAVLSILLHHATLCDVSRRLAVATRPAVALRQKREVVVAAVLHIGAVVLVPFVERTVPGIPRIPPVGYSNHEAFAAGAVVTDARVEGSKEENGLHLALLAEVDDQVRVLSTGSRLRHRTALSALKGALAASIDSVNGPRTDVVIQISDKNTFLPKATFVRPTPTL